MIKAPVLRAITAIGLFISASVTFQAQSQVDSDTFFLATKKGILGRIGRSISTDPIVVQPVKTVNPFLKFAGKKIASIKIAGLGLDRNINDSNDVKNSFILKLANKFHKNTKDKFIRDNLFFREGDVVVPLMLADNEIFLRDQEYLQDALIIVLNNINDNNLVDIVVITRDVFSIGGAFKINSFNKVETELKEENLAGMGSKLSIMGLYDKERTPSTAFGAEFIKRNINGNFFNWKVGFKTFNNSYSNQRNEETRLYSSIERPLVSRYTRWTGALVWEYNKAQNNYKDTLFDSNFRYRYLRTDIWGGYNIGARRKWMTDNTNRLRHFIAIRTFYTHFYSKPLVYYDAFNYYYADINGVLFAYSLYKQNFYRTNFIYGFGRNEDVPVGLSASATLGWTNKDGKKRNYYGVSAEANKYNRRGNFYAFNLRVGAFSYRNHFEDIDMLLGIEHFTSLRKFGKNWRNRNFLNVSVTKQYNHLLSPPLLLQSDFGLPYYRNGGIVGSFRSTVRGESVFFNMQKVLGFRFAPFAFAGTIFITPLGKSFSKTEGYTAFGGGFRTRNENLVLGTIEVKGYLFTRKTYPEMQNWRVNVSTNLKFRYKSSFIRRPDFVISN